MDLVRLSEAPAVIGVSRNTFLRHIRSHLNEYKIGRAVFFNRVELEDPTLYTAGSGALPNRGNAQWQRPKLLDSPKEETSTTSIRSSKDIDSAAAREQEILEKRKQL